MTRCRNRFTSATATAHEMSGLREEQAWRGMRWLFVWSSLASPFHPKSRADWEEHRR